MADINIQRKEGVAWWWWVIGLLVLLLLGWAIVSMMGGRDSERVAAVDPYAYPAGETASVAGAATDPTVAVGPVEVLEPVQQYLATCAPREPTRMGMDHQYTSDCIDRLVAAAEALIRSPNLQGVNAQSQIQEARQKADQLRQSAAESTRHSSLTRDALISAGSMLQAIQTQRYPGLSSQIDQLRESAQQVSGSEPLLEQREAIQRYFQLAGDALTGMSTAPTNTG